MANVITLAADMQYLVCAVVTLDANVTLLATPTTSIIGLSPRISKIVGNAAVHLIDAPDGVALRKLDITNSGVGGIVLMGAAVPRDGFLTAKEMVMNTGRLPAIDVSSGASEIEEVIFTGAGAGVHTNAGTVRVEIDQCGFRASGGGANTIGVDIGGSPFMLIRFCVFETDAGDTGVKDLGSSGRGILLGNQFTGAGTFVDPANLKKIPTWKTLTNIGVLNSVVAGGLEISSNDADVATFIPAINTFVPVGNNTPAHPLYVAEAVIERMSLVINPAVNQAQNQELQYDGIDPAEITVSMSLTVQSTNLGGIAYSVRVTQNGVAVTTAKSQTGGLLNSSNSVSQAVNVLANPGDKFKLEVANNTNTTDMIVTGVDLHVSVRDS